MHAACSKLFDRSRFVSFGRLGNGSRAQSRQRSPRCKNGTVWNVVSREHQSSGVFHLYRVEWSESSRQVGHCTVCTVLLRPSHTSASRNRRTWFLNFCPQQGGSAFPKPSQPACPFGWNRTLRCGFQRLVWALHTSPYDAAPMFAFCMAA